MLTQKQIDRLKSQYTDKAQALACKALIRLYDDAGPFECYLLAMTDYDELITIVFNGYEASIVVYDYNDLQGMYNAHGEPLQLDNDYVPRMGKVIYDQLLKRGKL